MQEQAKMLRLCFMICKKRMPFIYVCSRRSIPACPCTIGRQLKRRRKTRFNDLFEFNLTMIYISMLVFGLTAYLFSRFEYYRYNSIIKLVS